MEKLLSLAEKSGTYEGYVISRIELKQLFAELDPTKTMNARDAYESGMAMISTSSASNGFFIPLVIHSFWISRARCGKMEAATAASALSTQR